MYYISFDNHAPRSGLRALLLGSIIVHPSEMAHPLSVRHAQGRNSVPMHPYKRFVQCVAMELEATWHLGWGIRGKPVQVPLQKYGDQSSRTQIPSTSPTEPVQSLRGRSIHANNDT